MRHNWTDEQIEKLTSLMGPAHRLSLSQVAARMGMTRNAVAGKAARLGLKSNSGQIFRQAADPEKRRIEKPRAAPKPAPPPLPKPGNPADVPPGNGVYPAGMKCLYLDGDVPKRGPAYRHQKLGKRKVVERTDEKTFGPVYESWADVPRCQSDAMPGRPYCAKHSLLCYEWKFSQNGGGE